MTWYLPTPTCWQRCAIIARSIIGNIVTVRLYVSDGLYTGKVIPGLHARPCLDGWLCELR